MVELRTVPNYGFMDILFDTYVIFVLDQEVYLYVSPYLCTYGWVSPCDVHTFNRMKIVLIV